LVPRPLPNVTPLPLQRRRDPFDHRDWLFELKLDGFRALAYVEARPRPPRLPQRQHFQAHTFLH